MNQAIKIINAVGLMNQTPAEEKMGPGPISWWPHFLGSLCEKRKMSLRGTKLHLSLRGAKKIPSLCSEQAAQSNKKAEKKWGLAPFYVGNIYV